MATARVELAHNAFYTDANPKSSPFIFLNKETRGLADEFYYRSGDYSRVKGAAK